MSLDAQRILLYDQRSHRCSERSLKAYRATGATKPAIREVLDDGPCRIEIPKSWFIKGKQVRLLGQQLALVLL